MEARFSDMVGEMSLASEEPSTNEAVAVPVAMRAEETEATASTCSGISLYQNFTCY